MENRNMARAAGVIGMGSAVLWIISILMEYGLGLHPPGRGTLYEVNQAMFQVSQAGTTVAILGLWWAAAVRSRFGKVAVTLFALSYAILTVAGVISMMTGNQDLWLYPIGGLLSLVAAFMTGFAVAIGKSWSGWQRFMPLIHAAYVFLFLYLPLFVGGQPPNSALPEVFWGVSWFLMGLAVYTSYRATRVAPLTPVEYH